MPEELSGPNPTLESLKKEMGRKISVSEAILFLHLSGLILLKRAFWERFWTFFENHFLGRHLLIKAVFVSSVWAILLWIALTLSIALKPPSKDFVFLRRENQDSTHHLLFPLGVFYMHSQFCAGYLPWLQDQSLPKVQAFVDMPNTCCFSNV